MKNKNPCVELSAQGLFFILWEGEFHPLLIATSRSHVYKIHIFSLKITLLHIRTNRTNVKKEKSPKNRAFPGADEGT